MTNDEIEALAAQVWSAGGVVVPTKVIEALEMLENGALNVAINAKNRGDGYDEGYANAMAKLARETLDALAATPAGAPVVLPEPDAVLRFERSTAGKENEMPIVVSCNWLPDGEYKLYTEQQVRAMLATGGQAQADARDALRMWLDIHDTPAGFAGKYGKALDDALAAQQLKVEAAASAARAAIAKSTGGAA